MQVLQSVTLFVLAGLAEIAGGWLVCNRKEDDLTPWLADALVSTLPAWLAFATHLQRDFDAVSAACSLPWSNGPVEGHINRLKMLKRQMFGRAHLDLLQSRLCTSA